MAIFQTSTNKKDTPLVTDVNASPGGHHGGAASGADSTQQSLIAAGLTIEGKIEGTGHVRIAGRFKGDVNIQGNLVVDKDAKLNGILRARQVALAGELEGNIESAEKVELLATSVLVGDLKTSALTIASGSRIRGTIDCGWNDTSGAVSSTLSDIH